MIKTFVKILGIAAICLVGFSLGRLGHIYGGDLPVPHHWIYGPILAAIAIVFRRKSWSIYLLFLGIGVFISDFNDFTLHRLWGGDEPAIKRFWAVD